MVNNILLSCYLCNVAKMAVIPAEAGRTLMVFCFLSPQTLDT